MSSSSKSKIPLIPRNILFPFILLTTCFAWWGLANNMTDTLLAFFKRLMSMSDFQTSWIQLAFYGAYFCLAIPAALIVQRFSYKVGVLFGLGMFTLGGLMFYPAGLLFGDATNLMRFMFFLISLYVLAGGCSILETAANPYILAMGAPETATRRLNFAQSFNPIGSILGVMLSGWFILSQLQPLDADDRAIMGLINADGLEKLQIGELQGAVNTYVGFALLLVVIWFAILFCRMPACSAAPVQKGVMRNIWAFISIPFDAFHFERGGFFMEMKDLLRHRKYLWGVVAQFFYVGAQIGVWSYTIRYVMQELNLLEASASDYYTITLFVFVGMRFVCTFLMKYISPNMLLATLAVFAVLFCLPVMFIGGIVGVISLISISGCMSLMFPTIYGIASEGLGEKMKLGGCGLIMAILGGAVLTSFQGRVSDGAGISFSYIVPALCFVVVGYYGLMTEKGTSNESNQTGMPKIPGALMGVVGVVTIVVVCGCIFYPKYMDGQKALQAKADGQSAVQSKGFGGYYALENTGGLEILEVVPSKEKASDGKFRGVLRHYQVKEVSPKGRVKSENINYVEVGLCIMDSDKGSVEWKINPKTEDFQYSAGSDTLSFRGRTYAPISLELNHLKLVEEVYAARAAAAATAEEQ